ncbi:MAG: hypothetical protein LBE20_06720 [Deltaproteobacteria bacterium]|jgi:hypothetical protein|nr:hypothetical protein [Deltaproteobacteria bacterium]
MKDPKIWFWSMDSNYYTEIQKLYNYYYNNIEHDTTLAQTIRNTYMLEWWNKHLSCLIKYQLKEKNLFYLAQNDYIILREGAKEFLQFLYQNRIPLFIISAGIANIIEIFLFLKKQNLLFDNIFKKNPTPERQAKIIW